jgi:zinc transporter ZupT
LNATFFDSSRDAREGDFSDCGVDIGVDIGGSHSARDDRPRRDDDDDDDDDDARANAGEKTMTRRTATGERTRGARRRERRRGRTMRALGGLGGGIAIVASALVTRGGRAEDAHAFEWAGIFETPENEYVWQAQKVADAYADATMKMVIYGESAAGHDELEARESIGDAAIGGNCLTIKTRDSVLTPGSGCVNLEFSNSWHTTPFKINTTGIAAVSIFAEHIPTEFERDAHYLKDLNGNDVEAKASLPETSTVTKSKPWANAIGAAIIVNLVTLCGVAFLVPGIAEKQKQFPELVSCIINSFSAGALLSAAFYLMFYEATHLIKPAGSDEAEQTAWWASASIFGFLMAYFIDFAISVVFPSRGNTAKTTDEECAAKGALAACDTCNSHKYRVRGGIILGDFTHNLVDGIFIGFGFLNCGSTMGWSITAATVYHEIAQELADYLVLVDPFQGDLAPLPALSLNFVSGMSVILGVLISLGSGNNNDFLHGLLLAFGAGVYLQIAAAECMPRVSVSATSPRLRATSILTFVIGVFAISLVLLNHKHCTIGVDGGDSHAHLH